MNPSSHKPWTRLVAAARRAPRDETWSRAEDLVAPAGFATRVVALAGSRSSGGLFGGLAFERLAARFLGFACACSLAVTIWASMPTSVEAAPSSDVTALGDAYLDPVGALLEVVQS